MGGSSRAGAATQASREVFIERARVLDPAPSSAHVLRGPSDTGGVKNEHQSPSAVDGLNSHVEFRYQVALAGWFKGCD